MASKVPTESIMLVPTAEGERLLDFGEAWAKRREGMGRYTRTRRTLYLDGYSYRRLIGGHWSNGQWECQEEPGKIFRLSR